MGGSKCPLGPLLSLRLRFTPLLAPNPGDATADLIYVAKRSKKTATFVARHV